MAWHWTPLRGWGDGGRDYAESLSLSNWGPWESFDFLLEARSDFSSIWLFRSTEGKSDVWGMRRNEIADLSMHCWLWASLVLAGRGRERLAGFSPRPAAFALAVWGKSTLWKARLPGQGPIFVLNLLSPAWRQGPGSTEAMENGTGCLAARVVGFIFLTRAFRPMKAGTIRNREPCGIRARKS